jgi:dihydroneopterin aldolase
LQLLKIDLAISCEIKDVNDCLDKTIDYDMLCQKVTNYIETNNFLLIETVAEKLVQFIKENFNVLSLTVSVSKPHAVTNADNIKVTISR